ncbi:MAG: gliding motility-associated C-terminal domain-containing protein [Flavobacteriales bacterium]
MFIQILVRTSVVALLVVCGSALGAQCIVINEIMINGAGPNDGSNSPNTEEWVELYNTCNTPVDIGCMVLVDGDFSVTFPAGTTIAANDYFVIGSENSLVTIDFSWATCGCTAGSSVGIFTNGNEQLALLNENGGVEDAIVWGSGQFPVAIATSSLGACASIAVNIPNAGSDFEALPGGGGQGCSLARTCDGSSIWVERCGSTVSANSTNGSALFPEFSVSNTVVCAGSCVSFSDETAVPGVTWTWTFEGANTVNSTDQNPAQICYPSSGSYDVTLQLSNACGVFTTTQPDYIIVENGAIPIIDPSGFINLCAGESVELSVTGNFNSYQWQLNGENILGENTSILAVTESGEYTVLTGSASCESVSEAVVVEIANALVVDIFPDNAIVLCEGETQLLDATDGFDTFQWLLDGDIIPGAESDTYTATSGGGYSILVTDGDCVGSSEEVFIQYTSNPVVEISPDVFETICEGSSVEFTATSGFETYQWLFNGDPIAGATNPIFEASEAGEYSVTAETGSGCEAFSETVIVTVSSMDIPVITGENDTFEFCEGGSFTLETASLFVNYQWFLDGVAIFGANSSTLTVDEPGSYTVVMNNGLCEAESIPVEVIAVEAPEADILPGTDIVTCAENTTLTASDGEIIQWFQDGLPMAGENDPQLTVTDDGDYYYITSNDLGCISQSPTINVTFSSSIDVSIQASSTTICQGELTELTVVVLSGDFLWSTGEDNETIEVNTAGTYEVTVTTNEGCVGTATIDILVTPLPLVDAGNDTISDCSTGVMLSGSGTGTLEWSPAESVSDANDPFALANPSITTIYVLTATLGNCSATDEVVVEVDCASVFIPNVITPNGDGKNDVFRVISRGVETYELKIFNRWGNLVFESTNPKDVWDGGVDEYYVSDGTYVWTLIALDFNQNPILGEGLSHGTVTVLR